MEFKKYKQTLLEKIKQALKENKEYKINFWSFFILDIMVILTYMIFYFIFSDIVKSFTDWNNFDFIFYFILLSIISKIKHIFGTKYLSYQIIHGYLNSFLTKPLNTFFFISIHSISGASITIFIFIFSIPIFLFFYQFRFLVFLFLLIFSCLIDLMFNNFLWSFAFFTKNDFIQRIFVRLQWNIETPTPKIFNGVFPFNFFLLFPSIIGSFWCVEILKGNFYVLEYLPWAILLFFVFCFGTYINWKIGLKRYEGFS